jgi:hypothetical protein
MNDMMIKAPHEHGLFEVDEPTQPYSRVELDRLRRIAELESPPVQGSEFDATIPEITQVSPRSPLVVVPRAETTSEGASDDGDQQDLEEWFELEGRLLRVSLQSFAHFGFSGAPPGMLGAVDADFMSGAITVNGEECTPIYRVAHLTEVNRPPAAEPELTKSQRSSRRRKRGLWVVVVTAPLALALAAWFVVRTLVPREQPMNQDVVPVETSVPEQRTGEPATPVTEPDIPSGEPEPPVGETGDVILDDKETSEAKPKSLVQSDACVERRELAAHAYRDGDWALLEELTRRRHCWSRTNEAKELRMRALWELERFSDCVKLGAHGGSKEMQKWLRNCKSAL